MITFTTTANSATQLAAAAEMRGRVMGLHLLVAKPRRKSASARKCLPQSV